MGGCQLGIRPSDHKLTDGMLQLKIYLTVSLTKRIKNRVMHFQLLRN